MNSPEPVFSNGRRSTDGAGNDGPKRRPVLEPLDRVPEVIFGVLMAISFTGSISVASSGNAEVNTMVYAAFGCNIAWGLTDAVMYLLGVTTERQRKINLLRRLRATRDLQEAHAQIADALPEPLAAAASSEALEALRKQLLTLSPPRFVRGLGDLAAGLAIFWLVVDSTIPVAIPFLLLSDVQLALQVSNALALATLFISGFILGDYAGANPWRYGLVLAALGAGLIAAIIALGG